MSSTSLDDLLSVRHGSASLSNALEASPNTAHRPHTVSAEEHTHLHPQNNREINGDDCNSYSLVSAAVERSNKLRLWILGRDFKLALEHLQHKGIIRKHPSAPFPLESPFLLTWWWAVLCIARSAVRLWSIIAPQVFHPANTDLTSFSSQISDTPTTHNTPHRKHRYPTEPLQTLTAAPWDMKEGEMIPALNKSLGAIKK